MLSEREPTAAPLPPVPSRATPARHPIELRWPAVRARQPPLAAQAAPDGWRSPPATVRCRRCGRPALVGGPAGPGSTAPSPGGRGGGVAPAQPRPAAAPASRHHHGPLLAGRSGPSSSPCPATAGEAPPPAARCRAPGTAGRRGCRTVGRRGGTPGSANRRSGVCTDGRRPAAALAALVEPRSGLDADLPGPVGLPAGHQVSPPLAWLPGSDQLTTQAGTATPEPHGTRPPYSPPVAPAGRRLGAASDPKARRPTHRRPRVPPGRRGGGAGPRAR